MSKLPEETLTPESLVAQLREWMDMAGWEPIRQLVWLRSFRSLMEGRMPPGWTEGRDALFDHLDAITDLEARRLGYCPRCSFPVPDATAGQCPTCASILDGTAQQEPEHD